MPAYSPLIPHTTSKNRVNWKTLRQQHSKLGRIGLKLCQYTRRGEELVLGTTSWNSRKFSLVLRNETHLCVLSMHMAFRNT